MKYKLNNLYIPSLLCLLGLLWFIYGLANYSILRNGRPGIGFFPVLIGACLLVVGLLCCSLGVKKADILPSFYKIFVPIFTAIFFILSSYVWGFMISIGATTCLYLKFYAKYSSIFAVVFSICLTLSIYAIFDLWLGVVFLKGLLDLF